MTIFKTAYDTTVGSTHAIKPIIGKIEEAMVRDYIYDETRNLVRTDSLAPFVLTGKNASESHIPMFNHPIYIPNFKDINYLVYDGRTLFSKDTEGQLYVRAQTEYNFMLDRMVLNMAWLSGQTSVLMNNLEGAGIIFAAWISDTISKRYALDPADQMRLTIITHCYYQSLFYEESVLTEEMKDKFSLHTMRATKAPGNLINEVIEQIENIGNIHELCNTIQKVLGNVRLKDFSAAMLITITGTSWFGLNAKDVLAIAIEHPPTWCAIVHAAMTERSFKKSQIAMVTERFARSRGVEEYTLAMGNIRSDYMTVDQR